MASNHLLIQVSCVDFISFLSNSFTPLRTIISPGAKS